MLITQQYAAFIGKSLNLQLLCCCQHQQRRIVFTVFASSRIRNLCQYYGLIKTVSFTFLSNCTFCCWNGWVNYHFWGYIWRLLGTFLLSHSIDGSLYSSISFLLIFWILIFIAHNITSTNSQSWWKNLNSSLELGKACQKLPAQWASMLRTIFNLKCEWTYGYTIIQININRAWILIKKNTRIREEIIF